MCAKPVPREPWPVGFDVEAAGVVLGEDPGTEPDVLLPTAAIMTPAPALRSDLTPRNTSGQP